MQTKLILKCTVSSAFVLASVFWMFTPSMADAQTYTVLHNIDQTVDPNAVGGALVQGRNGNLYDSSTLSPSLASGFEGTIFDVTLAGSPTILFDFSAADPNPGWEPVAGLTLGTDGNYYGSTLRGGSLGFGSVFKVTSSGGLTALHSFTGGTDGGAGLSNIVQANDGNYYGCAYGASGTLSSLLYKLTSAGAFSVVHTFSGTEGTYCSYLTLGSDGNLYAVLVNGGSGNTGTIDKVTTGGVVTVLHNFFTSVDGIAASAGVVQANDGNFYSTSSGGGPLNAGVVYQLKPNGTFTVIHNFSGTDGSDPQAALVLGSDGNLYGTAGSGGGVTDCNGGSGGCGTVFKITTTGALTVLYNFEQTTGANPTSATLVQDTSGIFYGSTNHGGSFGNGVFYSLSNGLAPFAKLVSTQGKVGARIEILGQGFSSSSIVKFGGIQATAPTVSGTTFLTATVPTGALTGVVTVTMGATTLTTPNSFKVLPTLGSFTPASGPVGTLVTINGTGLTQTTVVTFNNKSSSFAVISDSQITATVPPGSTTGKIKVTTKGGSVTSTTNFTVN